MSDPLQRIVVGALLLAALGAAGCGSSASQNGSGQPGQSARAATPTAMDPAEVKTFVAEHPDALLLDVRNPPEWESELKAIDGAMLLPLPELSSRLAELEEWKLKPIVTVCRSGRRSENARRILNDAGFTQVINMSGGLIAWKRAGY